MLHALYGNNQSLSHTSSTGHLCDGTLLLLSTTCLSRRSSYLPKLSEHPSVCMLRVLASQSVLSETSQAFSLAPCQISPNKNCYDIANDHESTQWPSAICSLRYIPTGSLEKEKGGGLGPKSFAYDLKSPLAPLAHKCLCFCAANRGTIC